MTRTVTKPGNRPAGGTDQGSGNDTDSEPLAPINSVKLRGRVSSAPVERELPSGDAIVTFRLSVPRPAGAGGARARTKAGPGKGSRAVSDWVDCVVWTGRVRRTVRSWQTGDQVEIEGALRRRFFRVSNGASTRVEVEVLAGRRISRAPA